jgi:hypothetical protein
VRMNLIFRLGSRSLHHDSQCWSEAPSHFHSRLPFGAVWLEHSGLDHRLQQCRDFAFLTVENVENLAELIPSPFYLVTKIQEAKSSDQERHDGKFFIHDSVSIERGWAVKAIPSMLREES